MPFNFSGTLAAFRALLNPRLVIPDLIVQDIQEINFAAFRKANFQAVILDKDNCITTPHRDVLVRELQVSWNELKTEFNPANILIVSNSAGTHHDPAGLAAESVSRNLGVPVLRRASMKPSNHTVAAIRSHFASKSPPLTGGDKLIVIGDRVFTDIVLAKRLGAFSILVTRDWTHTFRARVIGVTERALVRLAQKWTKKGDASSYRSFIQEPQTRKGEVALNYSGSTWSWAGRALGWGSNTGKFR
ncbi:mitochondrial PGP phosphatase-domain-containing protein [Hysterangium stoloniferum]|nr:mitochondrial PGP phosphatase-domain-containing protein [Hysterangium stoloniferum]